MSASTSDVTKLLNEARNGDSSAAEKLAPLISEELHRLARSYMRRERSGHTLQTTALVNEAYLKLIQQREIQCQNRAHFFAIAATFMRRILVDYARKSATHKRHRGLQRVTIDDVYAAVEPRGEAILALDEALAKLEKFDSRQARIIELRFFGGLSGDETAEALQLSPRTVDREWKVAQAWLRRQLGSHTPKRT